MRFTADHLSIEEFQGPIHSSTGNGLIDAQRVYVGQLLRQAGDWIVWTHGLEVYDEWIHYLRVEMVVPHNRADGNGCIFGSGDYNLTRRLLYLQTRMYEM